MGLIGLDISEHNGANFDPVLFSPDFVILRIGYARTEDKLFRQYLKRCEAAGIPWGVYLYSYAETTEEAEKEARFVIDALQGLKKGPNMGVWFDMEDADGYKKRRGIMPFNRVSISLICNTFCSLLDDAGYYTGIYASKYWFDNYITTGYPRWVAAWGNNDGKIHGHYKEEAVLHQFTSRYKGRNLDASYFYGETAELKKDKQKGDGMGNIDRLVFGMHDLYITQGPYSVNGSSHRNGALDLAGQDAGIDFWYAQSRMKCLGRMRLHKGSAVSGGYGTYAFTFCDKDGEPVKVKLSDGSERFVTLAMTHSNQQYVKSTPGKIYEAGQPVYEEGGMGAKGPHTFGNHIHLEVAEGITLDKYYRPEIATYTMNNELDPRRCFFIYDGYTKHVIKEQGWSYVHCDSISTTAKETAQKTPKTADTGDIDEAALDVLKGKYGNGTARKKALTAAGYDAAKVQRRINELLKNKTAQQAIQELEAAKKKLKTTADIVKEHAADFDFRTFTDYMKKNGGYRGYLKKLGGVFDELADFTGEIKTASEYKKFAEYVFGLMQIYGFCYEGGGEGNRYGGSYPFYSDGKGGRDWGETLTIDEKCSGSKGTNCMSTDCGMGLDMLAKKAGIYQGRTYNLSELQKCPDFQLITNTGDLMVGDYIQCYSGFKRADKRKLTHPVYGYSNHRWDTDKGWFHVTVVGEIDRKAGTMTLYDAGHYFTDSGNYTNKRPLRLEVPYQWADEWCAYRVHYLQQDGAAKDTAGMIAGQVLRGLWGSGDARRRRLTAAGYNYSDIQKLVNEYLKTDDIETAINKALASEVWDGRWGSGSDRKRRLTACGYDYKKVQAEVDKLGK